MNMAGQSLVWRPSTWTDILAYPKAGFALCFDLEYLGMLGDLAKPLSDSDRFNGLGLGA